MLGTPCPQIVPRFLNDSNYALSHSGLYFNESSKETAVLFTFHMTIR
jgi:hypothetical protein